MKKHRVAVVGCGALAQAAHLPNARANPRIELVATCDLDRVTAEMCRKKYGAKRSETDWRRIVAADDIDLCILCTHTNLRGAFIIPALEAGKPVYTEKPLAPSRTEMIDIVKTVRRTGKSVCVGHNRRSSPAVLEMKRLLEKACSGVKSLAPSVDRSGNRAPLPEESALQLLIRVNDDVRSWKNWALWDEEGILFAEMVHFIDLALWFNPSPPVRVFVEGSPRGNFSVVLRFQDGSITTMHHTLVGHFDYPKELMEATTNHITIAMDQHMEIRQSGMTNEPMQQFFPYDSDSRWAKKPGMNGYMAELRAEQQRARKSGKPPRWLNVNKGHAIHLDRFLSHLEASGPNPCDVESAVVVNRVALRMLESARLGMPVAITPQDWHLPSV